MGMTSIKQLLEEITDAQQESLQGGSGQNLVGRNRSTNPTSRGSLAERISNDYQGLVSVGVVASSTQGFHSVYELT